MYTLAFPLGAEDEYLSRRRSTHDLLSVISHRRNQARVERQHTASPCSGLSPLGADVNTEGENSIQQLAIVFISIQQGNPDGKYKMSRQPSLTASVFAGRSLGCEVVAAGYQTPAVGTGHGRTGSWETEFGGTEMEMISAVRGAEMCDHGSDEKDTEQEQAAEAA